MINLLNKSKAAGVWLRAVGKVAQILRRERMLGLRWRLAMVSSWNYSAWIRRYDRLADDWHVSGWTANKPFTSDHEEHLGINMLPEHFVFPVGAMFWARVDGLKRLCALGLEWYDYPEEPLPNDGSVLHARERLFPLVPEEGVNKSALTNMVGMSR